MSTYNMLQKWEFVKEQTTGQYFYCHSRVNQLGQKLKGFR